MTDIIVKLFKLLAGKTGESVEYISLKVFILAAIPFCAFVPLFRVGIQPGWLTFDTMRFIAPVVAVSGFIVYCILKIRRYVCRAQKIYRPDLYTAAGTMKFVFVSCITIGAALFSLGMVNLGLLFSGTAGTIYVFCLIVWLIWKLLNKIDIFVEGLAINSIVKNWLAVISSMVGLADFVLKMRRKEKKFRQKLLKDNEAYRPN